MASNTPVDDAVMSLLDEAKQQIINGDFKSALDKFNLAISQAPDQALVYLERGTLYAIMDNERKAYADFDKAIQINPNLADGYIRRGSLYHKNGDLSAALADYSKAIALGVDDPNLYNNRAEIYFELGDFASALVDYQHAHNKKPDAAMIRAGLAIALHASGDLATAQSLWRSLIQHDERYKNWNWVGKELNWRKALVTAAQGLVKSL